VQGCLSLSRNHYAMKMANYPDYTENPPDRAFACKRLFSAVTNLPLL